MVHFRSNEDIKESTILLGVLEIIPGLPLITSCCNISRLSSSFFWQNDDWLLMTLLLSRYWSITSPLRYLRRRTKKRALVMIKMLLTRRRWCPRTGERVAIFDRFFHRSVLFLVSLLLSTSFGHFLPLQPLLCNNMPLGPTDFLRGL